MPQLGGIYGITNELIITKSQSKEKRDMRRAASQDHVQDIADSISKPDEQDSDRQRMEGTYDIRTGGP